MRYTCPISKSTIDEHVVRLVAFFVLILVIVGFLFSKWIFLFLAFDYLARIYFPKFSILKHISVFIMHDILKIKPKAIGAAPKRFAAGIGFFFSIIIFVLLYIAEFYNIKYLEAIKICPDCTAFDQGIYYKLWSFILGIIFIIAISLETFFSYCLGCKTYSWLQFFKSKFKK